MTKLLLILLFLPFIGFGQLTFVPDSVFEAYLEANGMGNGLPNDDYVFTSAIDTATFLDINSQNISDLTGIESFTNLMYLYCYNNQLNNLNISNNHTLVTLYCYSNQLTTLDVSQNTNLSYLRCHNNQLAALDVSNNIYLLELHSQGNQLTHLDFNTNTSLIYLYCHNNQLTSLDVSNNPGLMYLFCQNNQLSSLDIRNGNNTILWNLSTLYNPALNCISVDDTVWANSNWTMIDSQHYFSANCAISLGCTDTLACNYDSLATIDDGSCTYPIIWQQSFQLCFFGDTIAVGSSFYYNTGNYIDTLVAVNGCDSIVYTTINSSPPLIVNTTTSSYSGFNISCAGYNDGWIDINISGGIPPFAFNWNNGQSTSLVSNLATGSYSVDIIDVNNCLTYYTFVLTEPTPLSISVNSTDETSALNDGSANAIVLGGVPPYSYNWDNGITANPNLNLSPGLYTIDVIDNNGCTVSSSATVNAYISSSTINVNNTSKTLLKVTGLLGRETKQTNQPLLYLYDDGTVDKKIVIE